jgi:hypothetical protein
VDGGADVVGGEGLRWAGEDGDDGWIHLEGGMGRGVGRGLYSISTSLFRDSFNLIRRLKLHQIKADFDRRWESTYPLANFLVVLTIFRSLVGISVDVC